MPDVYNLSIKTAYAIAAVSLTRSASLQAFIYLFLGES